MSKAYDFIKSCGVFYVASVNGDLPAARPFGAIMEHRGALYISMGNGKEVYAQLKANPAVQLVAMDGKTMAWVRVNGKAIETFDLDDKQAMLDACPVLLNHFGSKEDGRFALFRIEEMTATLHIGGTVEALA